MICVKKLKRFSSFPKANVRHQGHHKALLEHVPDHHVTCAVPTVLV